MKQGLNKLKLNHSRWHGCSCLCVRISVWRNTTICSCDNNYNHLTSWTRVISNL